MGTALARRESGRERHPDVAEAQLASRTLDQILELFDHRGDFGAGHDDKELVATPARGDRVRRERLQESSHAGKRLITCFPVLIIKSIQLAQVVDVDKGDHAWAVHAREDLLEPPAVPKAGEIVVQAERGSMFGRREPIAKIFCLAGELAVAPLQRLEALVELTVCLDAVRPLNLPQKIARHRLPTGASSKRCSEPKPDVCVPDEQRTPRDIEPDPARQLRQTLVRIDAIHQHGELVAADPCEATGWTLRERGAESISNLDQNLIAKIETVFRIDRPQSLDVDQHDAVRSPISISAASAVDLCLDAHELVDRRESRLAI